MSTLVSLGGGWTASYYWCQDVSKYIKDKFEVPENSFKAKAIDIISVLGTGIVGAALIPVVIYVLGVGPEGIRSGSLIAFIQKVGMSPKSVAWTAGAVGGCLAYAQIILSPKGPYQKSWKEMLQ